MRVYETVAERRVEVKSVPTCLGHIFERNRPGKVRQKRVPGPENVRNDRDYGRFVLFYT